MYFVALLCSTSHRCQLSPLHSRGGPTSSLPLTSLISFCISWDHLPYKPWLGVNYWRQPVPNTSRDELLFVVQTHILFFSCCVTIPLWLKNSLLEVSRNLTRLRKLMKLTSLMRPQSRLCKQQTVDRQRTLQWSCGQVAGSFRDADALSHQYVGVGFADKAVLRSTVHLDKF